MVKMTAIQQTHSKQRIAQKHYRRVISMQL